MLRTTRAYSQQDPEVKTYAPPELSDPAITNILGTMLAHKTARSPTIVFMRMLRYLASRWLGRMYLLKVIVGQPFT